MHERLLSYNTDDSIFALASPWGTSAIAVIRTSGENSLKLMENIFKPKSRLSSADTGSLLHGSLFDPETETTVDEIVLGVYRGSKSYTGENSAEIFCHGSLPGIQAVLQLLGKSGFRAAEPGEFTFRAFFHGKMDLTRAEAVQELISSKTQKAHSLALHRLSGSVSAVIDEAKTLLTELIASIEIRLDYPEEDAEEVPAPYGEIEAVRGILSRLLATYTEGRLYQEGVRIAISGRTNAGKSSLFNLFVREERSIVSEIHGTTRDYIEALVTVAGIPVRLYDTAGLRTADNPIESEGVRRSRIVMDTCPLVLYIIDADAGILDEDRRVVEELGSRCLLVYNKLDKAENAVLEKNTIGLSAVTGEGFPLLLSEMERRLLGPLHSSEDAAVIDSDRQKRLLEEALAALDRFEDGLRKKLPLDITAEDAGDALRALGEITGEVTRDDVLSTMFSRFCVGK